VLKLGTERATCHVCNLQLYFTWSIARNRKSRPRVHLCSLLLSSRGHEPWRVPLNQTQIQPMRSIRFLGVYIKPCSYSLPSFLLNNSRICEIQNTSMDTLMWCWEHLCSKTLSRWHPCVERLAGRNHCVEHQKYEKEVPIEIRNTVENA
jgi:hypothetical protein